MTNNHYNEPAFPDEKNTGLTKLEYIVINMACAAMSAKLPFETDLGIQIAKNILDKLNKESNAND